MEFLNHHHQFGSSAMSSQSWDAPEISSPSGDSVVGCRSHSDEEVILASNRPKRSAGRKKFRETRHPVYRGVRRRNNDKWVCEVREPNKKTRIWLGTYQTAEMAARAHDVATLALRGRSACLNFADSVWKLPLPTSTDAKDIRKAATEAAELFRDQGTAASRMENVKPWENNENEDVFYIDEEAEFGMPGLMASMAEGLLLAPPPNVGSEFYEEDINEVPLWSFSF